MALILSLETATTVCSVALHEDGVLKAKEELFVDKSHSSQLTVAIDNVVKNAGFAYKDLSAVAVSEGPGSYTGLRIGTSTGKGLCYSLDIPLIAVNTLEGMANSIKGFNLDGALLCPMLDARRMEVYCAVYDAEGKELSPTQAVIVEPESYDKYLEQGKVIFFGNGSDKCVEVFGQHPNASFWPNVSPSAEGIGNLAYVKYEQQSFEDVAYFEPFYLKEFRATKPKKNIF
ncbi:tRNA (adenosine(37)-N6)-threonylcarbamoyltransferase complex dimerization subunit type 1 TsaB [Fulvitalea axinellae]|uniref:tRNA (Adenosine(37)-N6)-threonylcarbamoyltransferase complex dimerization subunit type 1 TsaB n=1 Tax=Fulvitalea axinellae TaxID=1182444 RepID=A0AAU9CUN8_9BACT|nr:tRNA (adenosine(37)-N6)-threonylcarbamoyltransferase complex dimerization subunit type 1 TsaB [Fulvitalea axinellae]